MLWCSEVTQHPAYRVVAILSLLWTFCRLSPLILFEQAVLKQAASGGGEDRGAHKSSGEGEKMFLNDQKKITRLIACIFKLMRWLSFHKLPLMWVGLLGA